MGWLSGHMSVVMVEPRPHGPEPVHAVSPLDDTCHSSRDSLG